MKFIKWCRYFLFGCTWYLYFKPRRWITNSHITIFLLCQVTKNCPLFVAPEYLPELLPDDRNTKSDKSASATAIVTKTQQKAGILPEGFALAFCG